MLTRIGKSLPFLLITILALTTPCLAFDPPQLIKNTNALPERPEIRASAVVGTTLFLAANFGNVGLELYKVDTNTGSLELLKDIRPGLDGSAIDSMVVLGSSVYFNVLSGPSDSGLWKSDGTSAGTQLVKSFTPDYTLNFAPISDLLKASGKIYFVSRDGSDPSGSELWYSDGTSAGTSVIDIAPGPSSSYPSSLKAQGAYLFFSADNGVIGREPYFANGAASASLINDINLGSGSSFPGEFSFTGTSVFFSANDGTHGVEPFISDGTPGGTSLLKDIGAGLLSSEPSNFSFDGTTTFFLTYTGSTYEVWKSNGTGGGTVKISSLGAGFAYIGGDTLAALPNKYLFPFNQSTSGRELFASDGTGAGTGILKEVGASKNSGLGSIFTYLSPGGTPKLLFTGKTSAGGEELWVTDGTSAGTQQLLELATGNLSAAPQFLIKNGTEIFFIAFNGTSWGLYRTDGSAAGTSRVGTLPSISDQSGGWGNLTLINGKLYGSVNDGTSYFEPWVTDGTSSGTFQLADTNPGTFGSFPTAFGSLGSRVLFTANESVTVGSEPWVTDGTQANTNLFGDFNPGIADSFFKVLTNLNGATILRGSINAGAELYRSDGTAAGTAIISDLSPGAASGFTDDSTVTLNGQVYFAGTTGADPGSELYRTDGISSISLVKDIRPGASSSSPKGATPFGTRFLFSADDGTNGRELWISDGTAAGTTMLADIEAGPSASGPSNFVVNGSLAYFVAITSSDGRELWRTDGSSAGTSMVKSLSPGAASSTLYSITSFKNGVLFKFAPEGQGGAELWYTDGTEAGTIKLQNISVNNRFFTFFDDSIAVRENLAFFKHYVASNSPQIFVTDGSITGTKQVTNLPIGPRGLSILNSPIFLGGDLIFSAEFEAFGVELYKMSVDKCVNDIAKLEPGICGCGVADLDQNGNGQVDCLDPSTSYQPAAPSIKFGKKGIFTLTGATVPGATGYEFRLNYKIGKKKKQQTYLSSTPQLKKKLKGVKKGTSVSYQMRVIVGTSATAFSPVRKFRAK